MDEWMDYRFMDEWIDEEQFKLEMVSRQSDKNPNQECSIIQTRGAESSARGYITNSREVGERDIAVFK